MIKVMIFSFMMKIINAEKDLLSAIPIAQTAAELHAH